MSKSESPLEIDPLLEGPSRSRPMLISPSTDLETSVEAVYEALIDDDIDNNNHDHDEELNEDVLWLREQRDKNKTLHWLRRPSVLMIASIIFLLAFGSFSGESTRQIITLKLACNYLGKDSCNREAAQVLMSNLQLGYSISISMITLVASGKVGPLSDLYGRKVFIVIIVVFFFIGRAAKFALMYNYDSLKFVPMILTEIITNFGGGTICILALANCYISDVTEPHERIYSLGISMASVFLGVSIGPLVGNLIVSLNSSAAPKDIQMAVDIPRSDFAPLKFELFIFTIVVFLTVFVLPESRSEKARKKSRSMSVSSSTELNLQQELEQPNWFIKFTRMINFLKPLKLLTLPSEIVLPQNKHRINKDRTALIILVLIDCMLASLAMSFGEIGILYGMYNFNWNQQDIGHFLAIGCASRATVLIVLSPIINHKIFQKGFGFKVFKKQFDMIDFSMILTGLVFESTGFIGYSMSKSSVHFFVFCVVCGFGTLISPAINSSIVKFYPESKTGELFGALALIKNLFGLVMPVLFLTMYKYSLSRWHRANLVFIIAGGLMMLCGFALLIAKRIMNLDRKSLPTVLKRSNSESSMVSGLSSEEDAISLANQNEELFSSKNPISELHRKSSFVYKERAGPIISN
ncbi:uncharacterized protein J8A68_004473 [[Candida] subhashii]|uniref:Major facilitator superfamily (MFS) profile domain-containing protein n=1 Tax=[Candida] subhashii TaxID=561895 RepID=A0A8J5QK83_9ASCO|nr:uncharacterized protein J8A68_004473 [[Candida] subhashii]KAG7661973.1 hypothetical protein J8A68_004473 [[Candida] subhashii]